MSASAGGSADLLAAIPSAISFASVEPPPTARASAFTSSRERPADSRPWSAWARLRTSFVMSLLDISSAPSLRIRAGRHLPSRARSSV